MLLKSKVDDMLLESCSQINPKLRIQQLWLPTAELELPITQLVLQIQQQNFHTVFVSWISQIGDHDITRTQAFSF